MVSLLPQETIMALNAVDSTGVHQKVFDRVQALRPWLENCEDDKDFIFRHDRTGMSDQQDAEYLVQCLQAAAGVLPLPEQANRGKRPACVCNLMK
jgi:hypothetical protein